MSSTTYTCYTTRNCVIQHKNMLSHAKSVIKGAGGPWPGDIQNRVCPFSHFTSPIAIYNKPLFTVYSSYRVLYSPCIQFTVYSIYCVFDLPCIRFTVYSIYRVFDLPCGVYSIYLALFLSSQIATFILCKLLHCKLTFDLPFNLIYRA